MTEHSIIGKDKPKRQLTVGVAIPSGEVWEARFGVCLVMLSAWYNMARLPNCDKQKLVVISSRSSILSVNREDIVQHAQKAGCDYVLSTDTDMIFPKDIIHRLIAHDLDFVAANCCTKELPSRPTSIGLDGRAVYTLPDSEGLVEVLQVGTGVFLFKPEIFEGLPRPWFPVQWSAEENTYIGMDIEFCRNLRAHGTKLFIDQDVSKEIQHVGRLNYTHSMVEVPEYVRSERAYAGRS